MAFTYSDDEQLAAMTAANAAANGVKRTAYLTSWQTAIGSNPKVRLYRDGVRVFSAYVTGLLTISNNSFPITSVTQETSTILDADIDTGNWELRVEKSTDSGVYFGATASRLGGFDAVAVSEDLSLGVSVTWTGVTFFAPGLDTLPPVETTPPPAASQQSMMSTTITSGAIVLAMPSQPTLKRKIVVPVAYYKGSSTYTDPTSVSADVWLDLSDLTTLKQDTAGTTAVTAAGQTVKRINNKGAAGGYFSNSTGLVLRQDGTSGAWYLEGTTSTSSGVGNFPSDWNCSDKLSASDLEVITGERPTDSSGSVDPWYSVGAFYLGDGEAGVGRHTSTGTKAYNNDGTVDVITLTHTEGADQIVNWRHTGGELTASIGSGTPGNAVSSGDTQTFNTPFSLFAPYHGAAGWPRYGGRIYQVVAKTPSLSAAERDFVQDYISVKMSGATTLTAPTVTDSAGNSFTSVEDYQDAAGKMRADIFVLHSAVPGTGNYSVTVTLPAGVSRAAAQAVEFPNLQGTASMDVTAQARNDGTAGSLTVTGGTLAQSSEVVFALLALNNSDTAADLRPPASYTQTGVTNNASAAVGLCAAYKLVDTTTAPAPTFTHDAGSGGAVALLAAFKVGANVDTPGGGGGGGGGGTSDGFTLSTLTQDMTQPHEMLLYGINPDWSWGSGPRYGSPNPPWSAAEAPSPALAPWGVCSTERNNPPSGSHNWRVAVFEIFSFVKRNGSWQYEGVQALAPNQWEGSYYNYETNASSGADERTSNGYREVKFPSSGATYHFFPNYRTLIQPSGYTHRAIVISASVTLDNPAGTDDRAAARVAMMSSSDYWKSMTQEYDPDNYSNDDMGIGRARKPAIYPAVSYHTCHTMTTQADIEEFIDYVEGLGVLR